MKTHPIRPLRRLLLCTASWLVAGAAVAENVAVGKPYEWSTPPGYGLCTDEGDATQLTDGISKDANWTVASTVGWVHKGRVTVTVDLGSAQPIGRVAFVAAGGGHADVFFPAVTVVLISSEGETWHPAGAIGSGTLTQDRSRAYAHRFETGDLRIRGRYVRFVFQAEERFLFLDEIEIHSAEQAPLPSGAPVTEESLAVLLKRGLTARWVAGEWADFREQIVSLAERAGAGAPSDIPGRLEQIDARAARLDVVNPHEVEALRLRYTGLRAEAARVSHGSGVRVQRVDPWGDLRGATFPPTLQALASRVDLLMWQDEYETTAWTVTNLGREETRVSVGVSPLQDEKGVTHPWTGRLWLRCGMANPTRVGYRVVDALPLLDAGEGHRAVLDIGAGEYRLLWLTVHAHDLPPGDYRAELRLAATSSGETLLDSPLALTVAPLRMPPADERALSACTWEYLVGWNQPEEAAENLHAYGVNTFILHPVALPRPRFSNDRTRLESVDFAALDAALARRGKQPRVHGVFWGGDPKFWGLDLESQTGAELFKQFIRAWAAHLAQAGIGPDQFFFYPLDEEISERLIRIGKLIKEADPRLQLYWNRVNGPGVDPDLMRRVAPYADIACLNVFTQADYEDVSRQEAAFQEIRSGQRLKVWTYACKGPGRVMRPDTYYRNLSWETFRRGGSGTGFWCYADPGAWDAYEGGLHYGVVYYAKDAPDGVTRTEPIIPSRRWEAFREGTEDFEYLHRLQQTIAAARRTPPEPSACDRAAAVLRNAVRAVLEAPADPSRYDSARQSLTQTIIELRR